MPMMDGSGDFNAERTKSGKVEAVLSIGDIGVREPRGFLLGFNIISGGRDVGVLPCMPP